MVITRSVRRRPRSLITLPLFHNFGTYTIHWKQCNIHLFFRFSAGICLCSIKHVDSSFESSFNDFLCEVLHWAKDLSDWHVELLTLTGSPTTVPPIVSPTQLASDFTSYTIGTKLTATQREHRNTQSTRSKPTERHILRVELALDGPWLQDGSSHCFWSQVIVQREDFLGGNGRKGGVWIYTFHTPRGSILD